MERETRNRASEDREMKRNELFTLWRGEKEKNSQGLKEQKEYQATQRTKIKSLTRFCYIPMYVKSH